MEQSLDRKEKEFVNLEAQKETVICDGKRLVTVKNDGRVYYTQVMKDFLPFSNGVLEKEKYNSIGNLSIVLKQFTDNLQSFVGTDAKEHLKKESNEKIYESCKKSVSRAKKAIFYDIKFRY